MFCLDNSEFSRNGDYQPTRLKAQNEAVNMLARNKTEGNPETVVGVLSMASKRIQVHVSLTREVGDIMKSLHDEVKSEGECNFVGALKTAQLVLKNRQNKSQHQRIMMFVGSPVNASSEELVKLAKVLKKNNVAVDIINFGVENDANIEKLQQFIETVNGSDASHLLAVPKESFVLADAILTSSILHEGAAGAGVGANAAGAANAAAFGIDPNEDPEMALALRMSMEEERARQQTQMQTVVEASVRNNTTSTSTTAASSSTNNNNSAPSAMEDVMDEDEKALLEQALAMSVATQDDVPMTAADDSKNKPSSTTATTSTDNNTNNNNNEDISQVLNDPDFLENLLQSAGVNKDDIKIDDLIGDKSKDKDKDKDKK